MQIAVFEAISQTSVINQVFFVKENSVGYF